MADQYTRITCGGSPLDASSPVTGLLFGTRQSGNDDDNNNNSNNNNNNDTYGTTGIVIQDADDIATDISQAELAATATIQVELHQAVFPQHAVVGWYRVSQADDQPVPNDLLQTRVLQQHYCSKSHDGQGAPFCFALLQAPAATATTAATATGNNEKAADEELPLTLYQLQDPSTTSSGIADMSKTVLVGMDHWTLATSDAEKIAVERVVREQPAPNKDNGAGTTTAVHSAFATKTVGLQHSLQAIQERLVVLVTFLEETAAGTIAPNHSLLRQVQGLMCQLGPIAAAGGGGNSTTTDAITDLSLSSSASPLPHDTAILQQLAVLGKTVDAVSAYTEKFRLMHDSATGSSRTVGGRDSRRF